jgi:hypothetical protein
LVGIGIGVFYRISFLVLGVTTVLTLAFALMANDLKRSRKVAPIALLGLSIPIFLVLGIFSLGRILDAQNSTKPLLAQLSQNKSDAYFRLCFPFGEPASAFFYQEIYAHAGFERTDRVTGASIQNEIKKYPSDIFVFREKQWNNLVPESKGKLIPVEKNGDWIACRLKDNMRADSDLISNHGGFHSTYQR